MHRIFKNLDYQEEKKKLHKIRVTTFIYGTLKDRFMDDCIRRSITEADLARDIIDIYYSSIDLRPDLLNKEMTEVKKYLVNRIKLE